MQKPCSGFRISLFLQVEPRLCTLRAERIFERFVRLGAQEIRGVGGTGLGLYIARELARELGGSLECLPRLDAGSTFVLDLPAAPPAS